MTATNAALRQASVEAVGGTALDYNSDWLAMFGAQGIAGKTFNEQMLNYVNTHLGTAYADVNSALVALAASEGATTFNSLGTFTASNGALPKLLLESGSAILLESGSNLLLG